MQSSSIGKVAPAELGDTAAAPPLEPGPVLLTSMDDSPPGQGMCATSSSSSSRSKSHSSVIETLRGATGCPRDAEVSKADTSEKSVNITVDQHQSAKIGISQGVSPSEDAGRVTSPAKEQAASVTTEPKESIGRKHARRLALIITDRETVDLELQRIRELQEAGGTAYAKFVDKLTFFGAVIFILTFVFLLFGDHKWLFLYLHTITFCGLYLYRWWTYRKFRYQFFLLDMCYFGNFVLLVYVWILPGVPELFTISFAMATGPLATAVFLFRNSLVFHSIDKLTSCFVHVAPFFACLLIRHYPLQLEYGPSLQPGAKGFFTTEYGCHSSESAFVVRSSDPTSAENKAGTSAGGDIFRGTQFRFAVPEKLTIGTVLLWPSLYYLGHLAFYVVTITLFLPADPSYLTLYRYVMSTPKKRQPWAMFPGGDRWLWFWYGLIHFLCSVLAFAPALLWYYSAESMLLLGLFLIAITAWNGANFYIEVFQRDPSKPKRQSR